MNAVETLQKLYNSSISKENFKYCLVTTKKLPVKIDGTFAKTNMINDFVSLQTLSTCKNLSDYAGIGISIQASNICAIDIDNCFSIPNNILSADERAIYSLDLFKDSAYCEFSFSGKGLRILFYNDIIDNYLNKYYIKNMTEKIEYYQPTKSYRYVTVTGNTIFNNSFDNNVSNKVTIFLDKYMKKKIIKQVVNEVDENSSVEDCMKKVKKLYFKDINFQNLWFTNAPGSGKDESERDYHLVAYLYENVTQNKDVLKQVFEKSNFFKTKDFKHTCKWTYNNNRYYNYLYNRINQK